MILVTGSCGYVAQHFISLCNGSEIICLDSEPCEQPNYKSICSPIEEIENISREISSCSTVIHLADLKFQEINEQNYKQNIEKHAKFFAALKKNKNIKKVIFASSCSVYGFQEGSLNESSPARPTSWYAKSKLGTELSLKQSGLPYTILRFGTAFGGLKQIRYDLLINKLFLSIKEQTPTVIFDKNSYRPYLEVRDFARALKYYAQQEPRGETINIIESNHTKNDILVKLQDIGVDTRRLRVDDQQKDSRNYFVSSNYSETSEFNFNHSFFDSIEELAKFHDILPN